MIRFEIFVIIFLTTILTVIFVSIFQLIMCNKKRKMQDKKIFYDANGFKPSDEYMKNMQRFLELFNELFYIRETNAEIKEKKMALLEEFYKKVCIKGVDALLFTYENISPTLFSREFIDLYMKKFRTYYKGWQKFDKMEEI